MICARCYGGSVVSAWDRAPEGVNIGQWMRCLACAHEWDADNKEGCPVPKFTSEAHRKNWLAAMKARRGTTNKKRSASSVVEDDPELTEEDLDRLKAEVEAEEAEPVVGVDMGQGESRTVATLVKQVEPGKMVYVPSTQIDDMIGRLELELQTLKAARDIMERLSA